MVYTNLLAVHHTRRTRKDVMTRKAFEKWYERTFVPSDLTRGEDGLYHNQITAAAWRAWKAQNVRYHKVLRAAKNLQGSVYLSSVPAYLAELKEAINELEKDDSK